MVSAVTRMNVRGKLIERADGYCEIGLRDCLRRATNAHHRRNRSQGGHDRLSNLLLACGSGTTGCHGWITSHPAEARRNGWTLWSGDVAADVPVFYRGQWVRLDDDGNVHLLQRGEVGNDLGHLHIGGNQSGQSVQHGSCSDHRGSNRGQRTRIL